MTENELKEIVSSQSKNIDRLNQQIAHLNNVIYKTQQAFRELDDFIDIEGIVVEWPGSPEDKIRAVIRYAKDADSTQ